MEHTHDNVLAAFLEPGTIPELAKRVNMSLAALAAWTNKNIDLLEGVHKLLTTRCKLIAAQLEISALTALGAVSSATTPTADARLRERALERQRKAAGAILRHRTGQQRAGAPVPTPTSNVASSLDALMPPSSARPASTPSSCQPARQKKLPLSDRLAARRLAALASA